MLPLGGRDFALLVTDFPSGIPEEAARYKTVVGRRAIADLVTAFLAIEAADGRIKVERVLFQIVDLIKILRALVDSSSETSCLV